MKVHVEFHDDARTKARITLVPGWLGRLFGAKTRTGEAARVGYHRKWGWISTDRDVGRAIVRELELQEVAPLPTMTLGRTKPTMAKLAMAVARLSPTAGSREVCACSRPRPQPINELGKPYPVAWWCIDCGRTMVSGSEAA